MKTKIVCLFVLALGWCAVGAYGQAEAPASKPPAQSPAWSREVLDLFSTLPIQDEGRVKPLSTYANFKLLKLNGRRKAMNLDEQSITPLEWLLDCLFYPEVAKQYKTFLIENSEVLDALKLTHADKKKRDRYSYAELESGRQTLFSLAQQHAGKETKDMTPLEFQVVNLAQNVHEFEALIHYLDFARHDYGVAANKRLSEFIPGASETPFTAIVTKGHELRNLFSLLSQPVDGVDEATRQKELDNLKALVSDVGTYGGFAFAISLFPPAGTPKEAPTWQSPAEVMEDAFGAHTPPAHELAMLGSLEKLVAATGNPVAFQTQLTSLHDQIVKAAQARGEYAKVPLEVSFYRGNYFYNGLVLYVLSFVLVALLWLMPRSRILNIAAPTAIMVPTVLLVVGITLRCIIRGRPPVTTLYETILFITAVVVIVALIIEYMNRRKIALSLAALMGTIGLFLANKFEMKEAVDTMPELVAVLDTNFWLSTHVTTVTMGYAAGLLAAAIAHIYILGKLFGIRRDDTSFYKSVARMTYGVLCFGLFFSVLGTVLGGIWANDSWGRFWGWDPKENGALMIVLWELAILHSRMGGYIRDLGVAIACVFGAIIVAFSWWGVNLLGVGLHSYGFTNGIAQALFIFYAFQSVIILLGFVVWLRERFEKRPAPERVPAPPEPKPTKRQAKATG